MRCLFVCPDDFLWRLVSDAGLVLVNDDRFVRNHTSGIIGNSLLAGLTILRALLALVVIPLEILGG